MAASGRLTATTPAGAIAAIPHRRCTRGGRPTPPPFGRRAAPPRAQLVGVELWAEPAACAARISGAPRRPRTPSAERTRRSTWPALARDQGNQLVNEEVEIARAVGAELGRHHVRAQEGRDQPDRLRGGQRPVDPQQPELVLAVEPVAALALDRRHAERPACPPESRRPAPAYSTSRCLAGEPHRSRDAAASHRDLQVASAEDPLLELVGAPAAEGEVGVAIDQPPDHQAATRVQTLRARVRRRA